MTAAQAQTSATPITTAISDTRPKEMTVDPNNCRVWAGNQRAPERLNEDSCRDLIDSFLLLNHQHTPALARTSTVGDDSKYEIIAGSRRLWAASWVREHHRPEFRFRIVLYPRLSDEQAFWLTDSENRERDDVSDYERAISYKHVLNSFYKTHAEMAERYCLSRSSLSRYLQLAELPVQLVNAFADWTDLKTSHAMPLLKLLRNAKTAEKILRKATELHIVHEERALSGDSPLTGAEVLRLLQTATRNGHGGDRGPLRQYFHGDTPHLLVTARNQRGITLQVPHGNGADIEEMVSDFRECLNEYYRAV